jgi:hypoxanthine phosphoribosyltransferase
MRVGLVTLLGLSIAAFGGPPQLHAQHRQRNVLTADEIANERESITTAYEAVQRLRPLWLHPHDLARLPGQSSEQLQVAPIKIYVNDFNVGDIDLLKTIPAETIFEMRWLSQNETASRYGPTDGQVAIVVTLKK